MVVGAVVAHDADGAHGEEDGEGLPDRVVEAVAADLVEIDGVGLAEDRELLAGDGAGAADGEAGAGEGVAADEAVGQAELAAEGADLVLEELAQGLDELEVHALGEAADVVVALDGDGGAAREADALDDVGVEGALGEELRVARGLRVVLEDLDEQAADGLALRSGSSTPSKALRKRSDSSAWMSGML